MAAHQASLSLGFSRQEHCSGLPFPSPMCESEVSQSCPTLSDPMDWSLPGSSVHGIFQARVLEWVAIAFSIVYLNINASNLFYINEITLNAMFLEILPTKQCIYIYIYFCVYDSYSCYWLCLKIFPDCIVGHLKYNCVLCKDNIQL